jgi:DNA modification methylase
MPYAKLILDDCVSALKIMPDKSVDLIFADPPYGNNTDYGAYEDTKENLKVLVNDVMPEILRVGKRALITCGVANIHLYPEPTWILSWNTPAGVGSSKWGFCCWQPILAYGKDPYLQNRLGRRPDSLTLTKGSPKNGHPCPKPLEVMEWIVNRGSMEGETVLDPFMGSGTTGVAAIKLNRNFIGIELDNDYLTIAQKRIDEALNGSYQ